MLKIGNRVKVMDNSHLTGGMIIEDDVFISICVSTSNDNTIGRHTSGYVCNPPKIRSGARIGAGANILPKYYYRAKFYSCSRSSCNT